MTEDDLLRAVLELAQLNHLRTLHIRPARTAHGWRTPVQGDGQGFPDLVLVGARVLYRELKADRGRVSADQKTWLDALALARQDVGIWCPSDLTSGLIAAQMRGARAVCPRCLGFRWVGDDSGPEPCPVCVGTPS